MLSCTAAFVACNNGTPGGGHTCESVCSTCGKCTNLDCEEPECADKCEGHDLLNYDMSGVSLDDKSETYSGNAVTLTVTGTLPQGVEVKYEYYSGEDVKEANKLTGAPVNAGEYTVVAKFTGDALHNPINDMTAKLTIDKADLEIILGATQYVDEFNHYQELGEGNEVAFVKNGDGTYTHEYDGKEYAVTILNSNADIDDLAIDFYIKAEDIGDISKLIGDTIENVGATVYVHITLDDGSESYNNFNQSSIVTSLTVEKRTVNISNATELELLRTEMTTKEAKLRYNTRYVLTQDIDLDGAVWKTIGAANDGDSFIGEFDGQGHKIYNFKITEESVDESAITNTVGTAFGFWGFLKDAYIHDVKFDSIEVKVDVKTLTEGVDGYEFRGTPTNPIVFGIVAGRTRFGSTMGTHFENITVTNADIRIKTYGGFYGTFVGEEYAGQGGADENVNKDQGEESEAGKKIIRKNLDASNIRIEVGEYTSGQPARTSIGGLVGELMFDTHVWEDCDLSEIIIINGDDQIKADDIYYSASGSQIVGAYGANVGGFIGLDYSTWQKSTFKNCTIKNFKIVDWTGANYTDIGSYAAWTMWNINGGQAVGSGCNFVGCKASNDNDTDYGLFRYTKVEGSDPTVTAESWKDTLVKGAGDMSALIVDDRTNETED